MRKIESHLSKKNIYLKSIKKTFFKKKFLESQLLSVGGGFVVFVALVAFLATIQRRKLAKRESREFHSPLIPQQIAPIKSFEKGIF